MPTRRKAREREARGDLSLKIMNFYDAAGLFRGGAQYYFSRITA